MRAVRYHEFGDPDVLEVEDVPVPTPERSEVIVAVRAASVNPTDARRRHEGAAELPKTTGSDFAGVVEAVGDEVTAFAVGDRVCGTGLHTTRFQQGSFAEYVAVPTDIVTPLPGDVSFEAGAAVALVGVTAWRALCDHAGLRPTETCFVHGGTGGVGHVAVQLAARIGAQTVCSAGSADAHRAAENFGADHVVGYDDPALLEAALAAAPDGFDVVLDHRVNDYFTFDMEAAAFDGRLVHYGGTVGTVEHAPVGLHKNLTTHQMTMSNLATRPELPTIASVLRRVIDLVDSGSIQPAIARRYDLEEAPEVHRAIVEDSFVGKLVVVP